MAEVQTLTKEKIKLQEPGLWDVIFLNDNITTMEFVIKVLKQIFGKNGDIKIEKNRNNFYLLANLEADQVILVSIKFNI